VNALAWHRAILARTIADRARLPHAILVHGGTGIGKTEFARAAAAGVLCESPRDGLACGSCVSCHWFSQGNHPDYREIVPEAAADGDGDEEAEGARSERAKSVVIKIDQIRAVADFVALTTHRDGFRVLLIHPAEALAPAAANALLKTLEEPPARTFIILVSDRTARLLATLRSRCRPLPLAAPPRDEALAWLREQGIEQPEAALDAAGGAPLLAVELAAPAEMQLRERVLAALARPGGADALQLAAGVDRASLERFIHWMQTWVYDLVRMRLAGDVRHHGGQVSALKGRARTSDLGALFDLDRELATARALAAHPLNARLLAEHLLMAYNRASLATKP
jgi:DNA polymerase-3 subunit delta'